MVKRLVVCSLEVLCIRVSRMARCGRLMGRQKRKRFEERGVPILMMARLLGVMPMLMMYG